MGPLSSYFWDFGDGATGSGVIIDHTFTSAGTYTVSLTVTDDGTPTESSSDTVAITVGSNLALGKPVTGGSTDWSGQFSYMVDGLWDQPSMGWVADAVPNWVEIDLLNDFQISKINAGPFQRGSDNQWYYDDAWNIKYKSSNDTEWHDFTNVNKLTGAGALQASGISITNGNPGHTDSDDNYKYYSFTFSP
ncbi:MAG: PKD domain-containing protein, partial [Deltaproteobacteria bacterium]